uniref:Uncharacterized protein n=1 Tax=Sphaerodactylus townsendi TaxID=933632 RepID=A0ACB8G605_9SAUR
MTWCKKCLVVVVVVVGGLAHNLLPHPLNWRWWGLNWESSAGHVEAVALSHSFTVTPQGGKGLFHILAVTSQSPPNTYKVQHEFRTRSTHQILCSNYTKLFVQHFHAGGSTTWERIMPVLLYLLNFPEYMLFGLKTLLSCVSKLLSFSD